LQNLDDSFQSFEDKKEIGEIAEEADESDDDGKNHKETVLEKVDDDDDEEEKNETFNNVMYQSEDEKLALDEELEEIFHDAYDFIPTNSIRIKQSMAK